MQPSDVQSFEWSLFVSLPHDVSYLAGAAMQRLCKIFLAAIEVERERERDFQTSDVPTGSG